MDRTPRKIGRRDELVTPQMKLDLRKELQQAINRRNVLSKKSKQKAMKFLESSFNCDEEHNVADETTDGDRRLNLRRKAIEEILSSEKSYISQLDKLIQYFVTPIQKQNLIDTGSHTTLFGQLELIHNINTELLQRLETNLDDVANAFLKLAPFFKIYSVYAFDYKNSMILLQNLTTKNLPFRSFLNETESRPEVQTKLNSLLITPIQRVPRYRLLLQQVLLYTSPADKDYKLIQESVKQIEISIDHINSCVEDQENIQKMLNIQNSLNGRQPNIMKSVSRKFIKEGMLFKYATNGTMMKRHCVLFSDIFMYCKVLKDRKPETVVDNSLDCCCIFPLKKCKINEIFAGKFKLTCLSEGIILCSEDVDTGRLWIQAIKKAIEDHIETRKTIRKDSSKRKPMRKKEVKKFERFEAELMSPTEKKNNFDKIFYGQNSSMTDIDKIGSSTGCFQSARRFRKRKHSECEENEKTKAATKQQPPTKKSFLDVITEKLRFSRTDEGFQTPPRPQQPRSILSPNSSYQNYYNNNSSSRATGELNHSYEQHEDDDFGFSSFVTNNRTNAVVTTAVDDDYPPKKRVKFDEENIVVSSITYQRQQQAMRFEQLKSHKNNDKSFLTKFFDYTASLF